MNLTCPPEYPHESELRKPGRFSVFIPRNRCGSAWPRWMIGWECGNWGIGAIGESWGIRVMLLRIHVCYHSNWN